MDVVRGPKASTVALAYRPSRGEWVSAVLGVGTVGNLAPVGRLWVLLPSRRQQRAASLVVARRNSPEERVVPAVAQEAPVGSGDVRCAASASGAVPTPTARVDRCVGVPGGAK